MNYAQIVVGTTPHYVQTRSLNCRVRIAVLRGVSPASISVPCETTNLKTAQTFHVIFGSGSAKDEPVLQVSDALPTGTTNAAGQIEYDAKGGFFGIGGGTKTKACDVGRASNGAPLVHCVVPDNINNYLIDVTGTAPAQPIKAAANAVRAMWGDSATNSEFGGNYKRPTRSRSPRNAGS